ncbi:MULTISPECIES: IclR family transcriptional regulator [unclassified Pseudomonas]|uniref:IclR family transcriptional regulator n=1 Tax=unclassified Pseudomonas TaxID=196821 RepID=UPI0012E3BCBB|nr:MULTISPECIES: IclR family transcriptional regulator [unclassified Pseudomonas]
MTLFYEELNAVLQIETVFQMQGQIMSLKTLNISLELLSRFSAERFSWGVREMSAEMGLSPSAVQRIMSTFAKQGFLRQQTETRRYELGVRFWEYGLLFRDRLQLSDAPAIWLREVATEQGETVYLNFLDGHTSVCVQVADSTEHVQLNIKPGERTSLHAGSRGKVMLAFLPTQMRNLILEETFVSLPMDEARQRRSSLHADLDSVHEQGFCVSRSERLKDVVGLSFPLFDARSIVMGSVTIGGPGARMTDEKLQACMSPMRQLAEQLQRHFRKFL